MKIRWLNIEIKNQRHVHIVQERFSYQSLRYWILYVCEQCIFISIFEEKNNTKSGVLRILWRNRHFELDLPNVTFVIGHTGFPTEKASNLDMYNSCL